MAIPTEVIADVQDIIGRGEGKRTWRARRMAATLRRFGYKLGAEWVEANATSYDEDKGTAISEGGTED